MFKHILLATDGSAIAERAAAFAVDLARVHDAKLTALYVVDPYRFIGIGESTPYGFQAYMSSAQECAAHAHALIKALCETEGTAVHLHGRTGLSRVVLGSVAARVVAEVPVPVLVVR
jgi:nucleotide-binding universal stress UspA family protein